MTPPRLRLTRPEPFMPGAAPLACTHKSSGPNHREDVLRIERTERMSTDRSVPIPYPPSNLTWLLFLPRSNLNAIPFRVRLKSSANALAPQ